LAPRPLDSEGALGLVAEHPVAPAATLRARIVLALAAKRDEGRRDVVPHEIREDARSLRPHRVLPVQGGRRAPPAHRSIRARAAAPRDRRRRVRRGAARGSRTPPQAPRPTRPTDSRRHHAIAPAHARPATAAGPRRTAARTRRGSRRDRLTL